MTITASTVSSMYDLAEKYLEAIVAAMTTTAAGAPSRAFVAPGIPVFETNCAQAAVFVPSLTEEQTAPQGPPMQLGMRHHRGRVNLVGLTGFAVRCAAISEGNQGLYQPLFDPTLDSQGRTVYEDGWAIWNYVTALIRQDLLFGGPCGDVHFDQGLPLVTEGGLTGWQFNLRVELDGYVPDLTGWPVTLPTDGVG